MKQAVILAVLALVWCSMPAHAQTVEEAGQKPGQTAQSKKKATPPSFQPGAEVTLAITIKAPREWVINYMVPFQARFDDEDIKKAEFSVEEATNRFEFEHYLPEITFEIPVTLSSKLKDGKITIPVYVDCSICDEVSGQCTFASEIVMAKVRILSEADPEEKNQAQKAGLSRHTQVLSGP